jgi:hypothetical protein
VSGGEVAGVIALVVAGLTALVLVTVRVAVTDLRRSVQSLDAAVQRLQASAAQTEGEIDRVDVLLERADRISTRVESASKLAYGTFAAPVIKALAVGAGTKRAAGRLRHRTQDGS